MFLVPSLFIVLKILHFLLYVIEPPHILILCWLLLQAAHVAGRTLGGTLHLCCMRGQLVDVYGPPVPYVGEQVSVCLPTPVMYFLDWTGLDFYTSLS